MNTFYFSTCVYLKINRTEQTFAHFNSMYLYTDVNFRLPSSVSVDILAIKTAKVVCSNIRQKKIKRRHAHVEMFGANCSF